ncbi:MAG: peptidase M64 [Alloprevotella sp.]|nr:peptidase M64 [Alloprevotella sp.]
MKLRYYTFIASLFVCLLTVAQTAHLDFSRTLRADYLFCGDTKHQEISLARLNSLKGWAGRRHHLDSLALAGNGTLTMTDARTGRTLYRTSFSTLFQEWLNTEEATHTRRAFENVFLLPMPLDSVRLTVRLVDFHNRVQAEMSHVVRPDDSLIRNLDARPVAPHRYIHQSGSAAEKIDVAIVAEGYTAKEADLFYQKAEEAVASIFNHEPFASRKDCFNFVAVALPSHDSGVSIPQRATWKETALGSHYNTFYSDRYLTTLNLQSLNDQLSGIPYEHIIILANSDYYGGGGIYNSYTLTTANHRAFHPVVVHEFGHSFGGLADEYAYDDQYEETYYADTEPWEQNLTTLCDFSQKWQDMLPAGTPIPTPPSADGRSQKIGVYEGAGYQSKGVWRAFENCRMRTNEHPTFCAVCQRALNRLIDFYTKEN